MKKLLNYLFKKQKIAAQTKEMGQGIIEYALLLGFIALAVYAVVRVMEPTIGNVFSDFVSDAPVAPPSLINYTPPPTFTPSPTIDPNASETPIPTNTPPVPPATATNTPTNTPIPTDTPTPTATAPCPIAGPFTVPGRVEMEDFRCGGSGVAFVDNPLNGPGSSIYRADVGDEGPDIGTNTDGGSGLHLGWVSSGEWVEYEVNAPTTGSYTLRLRYAAPSNVFPSMNIYVSQDPFSDGPVTVGPGSTGGWDTWLDAEVQILLFAGDNIVRFESNSPGTNGNYNYFEIVEFVATATPTVPSPTPSSTPTNTPVPTNTPPPTPTITPLPGGGDALLIVGNENNLNASDQAIQTRLQGLGYTVTVEDDNHANDGDAVGMEIIIISSTVNSNQLNDNDDNFDTVAVPLIVWEPYLFDDLNLTDSTANTHYGWYVDGNQIQITNSGHALAGGLSNGNVTITNGNYQRAWGAPNGNAIVIAQIPGESSRKTIFAYEAGASMFGMNAPARRVGFFPENDTAANMTNNGWILFDAAVNWASN